MIFLYKKYDVLLKRIVCVCFFVFILFPSNVLAKELIVAVAANMQYAFAAIKTIYEEKTGINIQEVIGSSGQLTAQIQNGAPFHVFISADTKYPQVLYENKKTLTEPKIYAYGQLVLWTLRDIVLDQELKELVNERIKKIALAEPSSAPYGRQAMTALEKSGLLPLIQDKLIFAQSISQVNQFILSQGADVGFTAKASVLTVITREQGRWIDIPQEFYEPIAQGCVLLTYAQEHNFNEAMQFYQFLFSEESQRILNQFGYRIP